MAANQTQDRWQTYDSIVLHEPSDSCFQHIKKEIMEGIEGLKVPHLSYSQHFVIIPPSNTKLPEDFPKGFIPLRMSQIKNFREKRSTVANANAKPPMTLTTDGDPAWKPYKMYDARALRPKMEMLFDEIHLNYVDWIVSTEEETDTGHFIELVIIEEPFVEHELSLGDYGAATVFLAEDKNEEVCTLQIHGLPENENTREMFAVGMKLLVASPHILGAFRRPNHRQDVIISMDETKERNIFPVGKKMDMCRYCGEENAKKKCSKCKYQYCDRECQVADWKLKHKLICDGNGQEVIATGESQTGGAADAAKKGNDPDPDRITHILNFRSTVNNYRMKQPKLPLNIRFPPMIPVTNVETNFMPRKNLYKPPNPEIIHLKDMECGKSYMGKVIELTVIEEPFHGTGYDDTVHFVVEDTKGKVTNLCIQFLDREKNKKQRDQLQFGARLLVFNPVYKLGAGDGLPLVRVDDLRMIMYLGMEKDICHFCVEKKAKVEWECEKCRKMMYCGEECKKKDLEVLKHELVCEKDASA